MPENRLLYEKHVTARLFDGLDDIKDVLTLLLHDPVHLSVV